VKIKKIAVASDHAGFFLKGKIINYLKGEKFEIKDFGSSSAESVDYPDYAHPLANAVAKGEYDLGISICATGNGINMTVNKHQGIRGALCWNEEMSRLARAHNDANICALPGRFISESEALLIVKTFVSTDFDGGRHKRRIDKIPIKMY
jgi:ribose 5-phosphate isomerase B